MKLHELETMKFEDSKFTDGKSTWSATSLYEAAKNQKCKKFKLPIKHLDLEWVRYPDGLRLIDFAYHMKRVLATDLNYPILMNHNGRIMDGEHRILKAISINQDWVWCVRLQKPVKPDGKEKDTK